jgi:N-dimethylarginine dimethylaminohydrolase
MKETIILGSEKIYDKAYCQKNKKPFENLKKILDKLKKIFSDLKIDVLEPRKEITGPFCRTLWVRDLSINVDNKVYLIPGMINIDKNNRHPEEEVKSLPNEVAANGILLSKNIVMDGGDIIQENNTILVGQGKRTNKSALLWLRKEFPSKHVIGIEHNKLHLDNCLCILPNKRVLYSRGCIAKLPRYLEDNYEVICVEDFIGKSESGNLACNILVYKDNLIVANMNKFSKLYKHLESLDYKVHLIPFYNLHKDNGGIRCLTQWYYVKNSIK